MKPTNQFKQLSPMPKAVRAVGIHITLLLACFSLSPIAQAVVPPPDGGYPGFNTAEGQQALFSLTSGVANTGLGWFSLWSNTDGSFNTAIGTGTLLFNIGNQDTQEGMENTAVGAAALLSNTTGSINTASGSSALFSNTTGGANTAIGEKALYANTAGSGNTANGVQALYNNTTGAGNTAMGDGALYNNTAGNSNVAVGDFAGYSVTTASDVTCIGANVLGANVSNTTWIGHVYGVTTQSGATLPVIVSNDGQLGTVASSKRYKKDIATMDKVSDSILSLRPVTFHYKADTAGTPQFGLIAEEVAKVDPALVLPDKDGKPYTVRYDAVNAMLLNEFLKEHKRVEAQQVTITELKSTVARQQKGMEVLTAQLKEQAAALQKVSDHLNINRSAPQLVVNP
ncbi:MAG: tail fiber domain-containing protein [Nitrospirota bacterium]|jgi:hypothetical protein